MISRLPHSVLSLVFGLGPWITAGQGKAVPCQEIFTVCEQPYTEMELLEKYAPDILHWVSNEVEEQYQDYMARIFNLMFYIPTFQRLSASLFIGARAR